MVNMKLRKPYTTATIWSSGKITCAGAKSEAEAYKAARRYCRILQKMQFKVRLNNFRVVNVLAKCKFPYEIDVSRLAENYKKECSYEPELHPGATFKLKDLKATLKIFTTGAITLTAPSVALAQEAIYSISPICDEYRRNFNPESILNREPAPKTIANQTQILNPTPTLVTALEPIKKIEPLTLFQESHHHHNSSPQLNFIPFNNQFSHSSLNPITNSLSYQFLTTNEPSTANNLNLNNNNNNISSTNRLYQTSIGHNDLFSLPSFYSSPATTSSIPSHSNGPHWLYDNLADDFLP